MYKDMQERSGDMIHEEALILYLFIISVRCSHRGVDWAKVRHKNVCKGYIQNKS